MLKAVLFFAAGYGTRVAVLSLVTAWTDEKVRARTFAVAQIVENIGRMCLDPALLKIFAVSLHLQGVWLGTPFYVAAVRAIKFFVADSYRTKPFLPCTKRPRLHHYTHLGRVWPWCHCVEIRETKVSGHDLMAWITWSALRRSVGQTPSRSAERSFCASYESRCPSPCPAVRRSTGRRVWILSAKLISPAWRL